MVFSALSATITAELIDTLWNVNLTEIVKEINQICELIDTLWNVNTLRLITSDYQTVKN